MYFYFFNLWPLLVKATHEEEKRGGKAERLAIRERALRKAAEKLSQSKSEFISMASHQLRTPLTAIKGYVSMFLEGIYNNLSPRAKEKMENVFQSTKRLIKLFNVLLNLSKIDLGKMELEK